MERHVQIMQQFAAWDEDEKYTALATVTTGTCFSEAFVHFLTEIAASAAESDEVRKMAIDILGLHISDVDPLAVIEVLKQIGSAEHEEIYLRTAALAAIGHMRIEPDTVAYFVALIENQDVDEDVRAAAFANLWRRKDCAAAWEGLERLIDDACFGAASQRELQQP
ncbi:hypothetical protein L1281_000137 [Neisseria sp. HSC-16F19]|nr:HEAT repeat domain-containing protein [Neisseria sp. HSC-16F19]MCP2039572.1 hypothetical protein [Neisseria sp. HSC-16F19]